MTKNEQATQKTTAALLLIAREHFTEYGYAGVSLEKIAEEGTVTRGAVYHHFKNKQGLFLAVLTIVQQEVAVQIAQEAMKSNDKWEQFILGCVSFVKGASAKSRRRILLVDAPTTVGSKAWRKTDQENLMNVLISHIDELRAQGYLKYDLNIKLMTYLISGALNELALHFSSNDNHALYSTIACMAQGFRNK